MGLTAPDGVARKIVEWLHRLSDKHLFLALAAAPVLVLLAIAPETFALFWPHDMPALGGLFFVLFLLAFDLLDFPKGKVGWTRRQKVFTAVTVVVAVVYFAATAPGQTFTSVLYSLGVILGAHGDARHPNSESFITVMYFAAYTVYLAALTLVLFNRSAIRRLVTPFVFSMGMMIFYLLDALFPYDQIWFLQFWANFIVAAVVSLARLFRLPIYGYANHLNIVGLHVYCPLVVFWPSVGVESMLMFSLVMVVVAARLRASRNRKLVYAAMGIAGTVFLNVSRVFSIAYYGYAYASTCDQVDFFHNSIGVFLLPLWVLAFVMLVIRIEDWLACRAGDHTS